MAPSVDDTVNGLKDVIAKLESRVEELENRYLPKSLSEQLRIVLMGPPGAGMLSNSQVIRPSKQLKAIVSK